MAFARSDLDQPFFLQRLERFALFNSQLDSDAKEAVSALQEECFAADTDREQGSSSKGNLNLLFDLLCEGNYVDILKGQTASALLGNSSQSESKRLAPYLREQISSYCDHSVLACLEVEIIGIAALNLFLQLNYTGPLIESQKLIDINPHPCFTKFLRSDADTCGILGPVKEENDKTDTSGMSSDNDKFFHNIILSELAVDGEFPCHVCDSPYFLYLARIILLHLAAPERLDWSDPFVARPNEATNNYTATGTLVSPVGSESHTSTISASPRFIMHTKNLRMVYLWSARAAVAHQRLLSAHMPSETLWQEVDEMFKVTDLLLGANLKQELAEGEKILARIMLERGLAEHHFNRKGKGIEYFRRAQEYSGLAVELTGSIGKRTKFQQSATAQLLVRAYQNKEFQASNGDTTLGTHPEEQQLPTMIQHDDEGILLERVRYEDEKDNVHEKLDALDQSILLSLCLNVKNDNPLDGLTAEEMGAYLERVLMHHDDWMIYSTALLERAWLECERTHGRERAILQIQALVDQHEKRLTLTQSTFESIDKEENFAPVQKRLINLHSLVYPPRWEIKADLATRYAKLGIVTTAAEIFQGLDMFPEAVECYQRASKLTIAEKIVRERLTKSETPRMWSALGDITKDPAYYKKAIELSNGKFSSAFVALGKHYFDIGDLTSASDYIGKALVIKPLNPGIWFYYGTINMKLGEWDAALEAFSQVVQQEPEEGEAWANIAAIHMRKQEPAKAYPALAEALKQNRNNWRVWWSKLFVCLDLLKYDEAIQACNQLMDFRMRKNMAANIPLLEERCIRGLVGGTLRILNDAKASGDAAAIESATRTIDRLSNLLQRLSSSISEPWIWQVFAFFHENLNRSALVLDDLLKEFRLLQTTKGWETDAEHVKRVVNAALQINAIYQQEGSKESEAKARLMINRLIKRIKSSYMDTASIPNEVALLEEKLEGVSTVE